jgi:hypothetical protein
VTWLKFGVKNNLDLNWCKCVSFLSFVLAIFTSLIMHCRHACDFEMYNEWALCLCYYTTKSIKNLYVLKIFRHVNSSKGCRLDTEFHYDVTNTCIWHVWDANNVLLFMCTIVVLAYKNSYARHNSSHFFVAKFLWAKFLIFDYTYQNRIIVFD